MTNIRYEQSSKKETKKCHILTIFPVLGSLTHMYNRWRNAKLALTHEVAWIDAVTESIFPLAHPSGNVFLTSYLRRVTDAMMTERSLYWLFNWRRAFFYQLHCVVRWRYQSFCGSFSCRKLFVFLLSIEWCKYPALSLFSCPGQLNRWLCQSLIKWVSEWVTFDFSVFRAL